MAHADGAPESEALRRDSQSAIASSHDDDLQRALKASQDAGALQRSTDDNLQRAIRESRKDSSAALSSAEDDLERAIRESRKELPAALGSADDDYERAIVASQRIDLANAHGGTGGSATSSHFDDDLQRAIRESRNAASTDARTRGNNIASPLSLDDDLEQAIRASLATVSATNNDSLERAIVASRVSAIQPLHMTPGRNGFQYDAIRLTSNSRPTAPVDWFLDHEDLPRVTICFQMAWRVTICVNIVARSRRSFEFEAVVEVELRTEDLGKHLRAHHGD